jgi:hypothetical protein
MNEDILLPMLNMVKQVGTGRYKAQCPAHGDNDPSLSLYFHGDGRILLHCFSGCSALDVVNAMGLRLSDLFPERIADRLPGGTKRIDERKSRSRKEHLELMLTIATELRSRGERLSAKMLSEEREAFLSLRQL